MNSFPSILCLLALPVLTVASGGVDVDGKQKNPQAVLVAQNSGQSGDVINSITAVDGTLQILLTSSSDEPVVNVGMVRHGIVRLERRSKAGTLLWCRDFAPPSPFRYTGAAPLATAGKDGGWILLLHANDFNKNSVKIAMMRLDDNGNTLCRKTICEPSAGEGDYYFAIVECRDGGYALAGTRHTLHPMTNITTVVKTPATQGANASSTKYAILRRLDNLGRHRWSRVYVQNTRNGDGDDRDELHDIRELPDGGFLVQGEANGYPEGSVEWLFRVNAAGNLTWVYRGTLCGEQFCSSRIGLVGKSSVTMTIITEGKIAGAVRVDMNTGKRLGK